MNIGKDYLVSEMERLGYEFKIEVKHTDKDSSKFVEVGSKHSIKPLKFSFSYSSEWTDMEIKEDIVLDAMRWAGLVLTAKLEYK